MIKKGRKLAEIYHGGGSKKNRNQKSRQNKRPWAALLALMILATPINAEALENKEKPKAIIEKPAPSAPSKIDTKTPSTYKSANGCSITKSDLNTIIRNPENLSNNLAIGNNNDKIVRRKALTIDAKKDVSISKDVKKSVDVDISDRSLLALIAFMEASKLTDIKPATFYQMLLAQEKGNSHAATMIMLPYRQITLTEPVTLIEGKTPEDRISTGLERARWLIKQYEETRSLANILIEVADNSGVPFEYLLGMGAIESSYYPSARAHIGSATGLYQFINQTWLHMVKTYGHKYGLDKEANLIYKNEDNKWDVKDNKQKSIILDKRYDAKLSAYMAAEYALENGRFMVEYDGISKKVEDFTPTDYYMAHFFGADEAAKFFAAYEKDQNQAAAPLFPAAARNNKGVFYTKNGKEKSLNDVYQFFDFKIYSIISQYKAATNNDYGLKFTLPPKPTRKPTAPPKQP